ncbi:MAG: DUF1566 domain-containing protein [Terracidiphilus sp.]|jgi:hypothetical protein
MIAKNRAVMALMITVLALGAGMAYGQQTPPAQQTQQQQAQQDEGPILMPKTQSAKPAPAKPATPTLTVSCDLACNWTLDGTAKGRIDAGASVKAKVKAGPHTVTAETEDALDKAENEITVKATGQTSLHLLLQSVRDARLKAEQEAKDKADQEAQAKAEQEAKDKAEQEAKAKAEQEARDKAFIEARHKASQEAQAKAEQEARDKAFIEARDKASREAQARAEQEAHDKAVRDEWDREHPGRAQAGQQNQPGGVWTDPATGLMWTRKDNGFALRWQPAVEYCRNLQLGGYSNWRLPKIDELKTIYNPNAGVACGANGYMSCQIKGGIRLTSGVVWSSSGGDEPQTMRGFIFRGQGELKRHVVQLDKRGASYDRALCVRRAEQ